MGVKITIAEPAPAKVPVHMPKSLKRDLRADPMGPAMKEMTLVGKPTKEQMLAAWNELRPLVNLIPYYSEDWGPVLSRHRGMLEAVYAGKVKDVRGLQAQIIAAYKKIMKTGKWRPGPWGKTEPK